MLGSDEAEGWDEAQGGAGSVGINTLPRCEKL